MICPICAADLSTGAAICPGCGTDLTDYLTAVYQADCLYNDALNHIHYQRYPEAADVLCRACAMRPADTELLRLRIRCEYLSGNKKRALELMTGLLDLEPTDQTIQQLNELAEEYDLEQAKADVAVKTVLKKESDRLSGLLDRLENDLSRTDAAPAIKESSAGPAQAQKPASAPHGMPDFASLSSMFPPPNAK